MNGLEKFDNWVKNLPAWCRWFFTGVFVCLLLLAGLYFTFFRPRPADDGATAGGQQPIPDTQAGESVGGMDTVVNESAGLVETSESLIAEARSGKQPAQTGK